MRDEKLKIAAIIQARMNSTRLPGKVLRKVLGIPLLQFQIEKVRRSSRINEVIIATTTNEMDDPIIELCKELDVSYFRGSENDVLSRYYECALNNEVDVIVRLTSDCPLIDHNIIDQVINTYLKNQDYDYVSNTLQRTFPRGYDTGVLCFKTLKEIYELAKKDSEREHVTLYLHHNPQKYNLMNVKSNIDYSSYRLTVDTREDFELISQVLTKLYPKNPHFTFDDVINIMIENPGLKKINEHIEQKEV